MGICKHSAKVFFLYLSKCYEKNRHQKVKELAYSDIKEVGGN